MNRNEKYWTLQDYKALKAANSFESLVPIAINVLQRLPKPISAACGPMSNGGMGSLEENMVVFCAVTDELITQGFSVFDQAAFPAGNTANGRSALE